MNTSLTKSTDTNATDTKSTDTKEHIWKILKSYYNPDINGKLVRHQQESYDNFVDSQLQHTIEMFNPICIRSENDYNPDTREYNLEVEINIKNLVLNSPTIHENNGVRKTMTPYNARSRNFTYDSLATVDIEILYHVAGTSDTFANTLNNVSIGKIPVMIKSSRCILSDLNHTFLPGQPKECPMDPGGYFIINGSEKVCIAQERMIENKALCFNISKSVSKYSHSIDIKSVPQTKCISPRQFGIMISKLDNGFGNPMYTQLARIRQPIPLFILFRAYGVESDRDICEFIIQTTDKSNVDILHSLRASIVDASNTITQEDAIDYIAKYAMYTAKKSPMDQVVTDVILKENASKRLKFTEGVLENEVLPHCENTPNKLCFIGHMVRRVIRVRLGHDTYDDRDSYLNKRIDTTGVLMNNLFRNYYNKMTRDMQKHIVYEINNGSWKSTDSYNTIINSTNIYKIIKPSTIENGIRRALSTGDFGTRNGNDKVGVAQVLNRLNHLSMLSHMRRVNTPIDKSGKLIAPRKLHPTIWGSMCPTESPEGASVGVVKNIASMSVITISSNSRVLYDKLSQIIDPIQFASGFQSITTSKIHTSYSVICNGDIIGTTDHPMETYDTIKKWKMSGMINIYTSVIIDTDTQIVNVCNDGGRVVRPLFIMNTETNRLVIDEMNDDPNTDFTYDSISSWDELLTNITWGHSIIEYVDIAEQSNAMILVSTNTQHAPGVKYTHAEIHPSTMFGVLASCIPFPDHNQSPRNTYQCAMGKQAMGTYSTEHGVRMDKTAYIMSYPSRPIVDTRLSSTLQLHKMPCGAMINVAIMTYTGYNQEDSMIINQGAIDRGLFQTTVIHTERDEDSNTHGEEEIRGKPDKSRTQGIKFGNYDKIGANGIIPENTKLDKGDVIMAKVSTIKENRNDHRKIIKYRDESIIFRSGDNCHVDKVLVGRNGDGYKFCKMKIRDLRRVSIGDKFSSRHGQKGTAGNVIPESDMPFTQSGIRPDLIINPHAIPSRMTIAQLKETILGKVLIELGMFGDGTPFGDLTVDNIRKKLVDIGYESNGNELMYNGMTGEQLECSVFIGPVYYQRLKHMVEDKNHSRSVGPMVNMTRQPAEGRSRDGGLRIGEMERDCIASHGAARFCRERLYDSSDAFRVHSCNKCGMISPYNKQFNIHVCNMCDNKTDFAYVEIPYACKLMFQELMAMNITPRMITE